MPTDNEPQTRKQYTSYVDNPSEAIGVPDTAYYHLDINDARRILRLSEVVRANEAEQVYAIEVFDQRVEWTYNDEDDDDEGLRVEPGVLKITASTCWFTGDFAGSEVSTKALDLAELAAEFDLTDEFPRYRRRSPGPR